MDTEKKSPWKFLGLTATYWVVIGSVVGLVALGYVFEVMHRARQTAPSGTLIAHSVTPMQNSAHRRVLPAQGGAHQPSLPSSTEANAYLANLNNNQPPPVPADTAATTSAAVAATFAINASPSPAPSSASSATPVTDGTQESLLPAIQTETTQVIGSQQADIRSLTATIQSLQTTVANLSTVSKTIKKDALIIKTLRAHNFRLYHLYRNEEYKATRLIQELSARPVLPGWRVTAVNGHSAVLGGPNGAIRLVHPGEIIFGVRIVSINAKLGTVVTSAGPLTGR